LDDFRFLNQPFSTAFKMAFSVSWMLKVQVV
jgi:hypothetical protein